MLDIVRRSKGTVRIIIYIAVVGIGGTFVVSIFAVWGGGISQRAGEGAGWIIKVDGDQIPAAEFNRRRKAMEQDLREQLAGQEFDDEMLAGLVDQRALGSLLSFYLAQREAQRAGLRVVPSEVSESIRGMPVFQGRDGRFVGAETYRQILTAQGINVANFEQQVSQELAANKVRLALFAIARADEAEVDRRFREEIERVDVDYVLLSDGEFTSDVTPKESDLRGYYETHAGDYMSQEARNASFVLFDREARAAAIEVPEEELRSSYEAEKATRFTHGEQRRASHILLRLNPGATPEEEAAQESAANEILAAVRSGESFEDLARERSEDPGSAPEGGDLGWFERGRMIQEFEDVAFALPEGSISDVVRTAFGFHIIKTTGSRPEGTRSFEEVREEIHREIAVERAQEEVRRMADEFTTRLASQTSSFQATASEMALTVEQTGLFGRGEPAGRLGRLPLAEDAIFSLSPGTSSAAVSVPQGLAVFHLESVEEPRPKAFEEVRDQVEEDWKRSRARELARAAARRILDREGSLRERVEGRDLEVTSYAAVTRRQPMPPLTDGAKEAALVAEVGTIIGPFEADDGLLILQVLRRAPETKAEAQAERTTLRQEILDEEREALFQSVMVRAQQQSEIDINQALLRTPAAVR